MIPGKLTLSEFQRCFVKIYYMPHTIFCFYKSHCFQKKLKKPCLLGTHKFDCPLFLLWHYTHVIGMTVLHQFVIFSQRLYSSRQKAEALRVWWGVFLIFWKIPVIRLASHFSIIGRLIISKKIIMIVSSHTL